MAEISLSVIIRASFDKHNNNNENYFDDNNINSSNNMDNL